MLSSIGRTPLIRLERLPTEDSAEVWVKWEGANPTGSMKDRMALAMVDGAVGRGELIPGGTVVDYTGGSTGSSLAMVCAARGFRSHFVTSDAFAASKLNTMRAFGAKLEIFPSENGKITAELIRRCLDRVEELRTLPGYFFTDQLNNVDNRRAYNEMAIEILESLNGEVDSFVAGVGTGGCFSGNSEVLKARLSKVRCHAVEPASSQVMAGFKPTGGHRLQGMGAGFITGITRLDLADSVVPVSDEDAISTAKKLATVEGVFGGISSGANVFAALQIAKRLGRGRRVVTVICDSGLKYLDGDLFGE